MKWPDITHAAREIPLPEGVRIRRLNPADIHALPSTLTAWHPELAIQDPILLMPEFYAEAVALHGRSSSTAQHPTLALVLESNHAIVAFLALDHQPREGAVACRIGIIHPAWRSRGLDTIIHQAAAHIAKAMPDVDLLYALADLDDHSAYATLTHAGYKLWGILPNAGRRQREGEIFYTPRAGFVMPLVDPKDILWPPTEGMRPQTAALMHLLFGHGENAPSTERPNPPLTEFEPAITAAYTAHPQERAIWPDGKDFAHTLPLPPDVTVRQLSRNEIPHIIDAILAWHPPIRGSMLEPLLTPSFYHDIIALAGDKAHVDERPGYALIGEVNGELALFFLIWFDDGGTMPWDAHRPRTWGASRGRRTLRGEFMAISPKHRRSYLSHTFIKLWILIARAIGCDTITAWATLEHPFAQMVVERCGVGIAGIVPAAEREIMQNGEIKHVFEALYAASLAPVEQIFWPPHSAMPARIADLTRFIYGTQP